jgi:hypothetical protein
MSPSLIKVALPIVFWVQKIQQCKYNPRKGRLRCGPSFFGGRGGAAQEAEGAFCSRVSHARLALTRTECRFLDV